MKVGDLVIVASLGEIKAYKANPRTPEAEAGLKPDEVKLDLVKSIDIIEAHKHLKDLFSDNPNPLKGRNSGERHNLSQEVLKEVEKTLAEDINLLIDELAEKRVFLAVPKEHSNEILKNVKQDKVFKVVEKDLIKEDKNKLLDFFKPNLK